MSETLEFLKLLCSNIRETRQTGQVRQAVNRVYTTVEQKKINLKSDHRHTYSLPAAWLRFLSSAPANLLPK